MSSGITDKFVTDHEYVQRTRLRFKVHVLEHD